MSLSKEAIIANVMGYWPPVSTTHKIYVRNTLRSDRKPGCWFAFKWNDLRLFDFGDTRYNHANYFDLVALKHFGYRTEHRPSIIPEVKEIIAEMGGAGDYKNNYTEDNFTFDIRWQGLGLTKEVEAYYSQFKIPEYQLRNDRIEAVDWYEHNSRENPALYERFYPNDLCIALPRGSRTKIYRPFQDNEGKIKKWVTNTIRDDFYHFPRKKDLLIITGSHKDGRAVYNHGYSTWAWQSETSMPSNHDVKKFAQYEKILYLGDIDKGGIDNAKINVKKLRAEGLKVYNAQMPLGLLRHGIKDFSELVMKQPDHSGYLLNKTIERCLKA